MIDEIREYFAYNPVMVLVTVVGGIALIISGLFAVVSPDPKPETSERSTNTGYAVERLYTDADGYTVKRFQDKGYTRYYVTGPGEARVEWTEPHGRTTRPVEIPTTQGDR